MTRFADLVLHRQEFKAAIARDRQLTATKEAGSPELPSWATCASVAVAAGVPFVGFGFLDNGIMVSTDSPQSLSCKAECCMSVKQLEKETQVADSLAAS